MQSLLICMKCQILFNGKLKEKHIIRLSSDELALRVVKVVKHNEENQEVQQSQIVVCLWYLEEQRKNWSIKCRASRLKKTTTFFHAQLCCAWNFLC